MPETKVEVRTFEVNFTCDNCHQGVMRPNGLQLNIHPVLYPHQCDLCNYEENFLFVYPYTVYESIDANYKRAEFKQEDVSSSDSDKSKLIDLIKSKALKFGAFTLSSGKKSPFYLDLRQVTLCAEGAGLIASSVYKKIQEKHNLCNAIGGPVIGADPIVGATLHHIATSYQSPSCSSITKGFLVRKQSKDHGTGKRVEGPLDPGDCCAIIEDVCVTGESALDAIAAVEEMGATVWGVICVVDRQEGARELITSKGFSFLPILTLEDLGIEL